MIDLPQAQCSGASMENLRWPSLHRRFFSFIRLCVALWLSNFAHAAAPTLTELQTIDFGVLALVSNVVTATAQLSPQGNTAYHSNFVFISAASPGRYRLEGYPPYTNMTVSLSSATLALNGAGPGELLTLASPVTRPVTLRTDQNGAVEFSLGATLATSGNGIPYEDGTYLGRPILTLAFEVDGVPVQGYHDIDSRVELRSSLELTELDTFDFGRISVSASASNQASLTLRPDGLYAISNSGTARIIMFGGATPGRFRISAGAAFAAVSVTLPSGTIYLTHTSNSASIARLLVDNFTIQPSAGNLKLDAGGAVEFRLGATLSTELGTRQYADGEYTGTFPLTVEY